ncbi:MAG TPA: FtsX-like permease family protein [Gemmatimonadales bacterium]|nr:FtsX-like permease family protein [Gemmatimonadales bacterium]
MSALGKKLVRDLGHLRGPLVAIALMSASGVSVFVAMRSMHGYLLGTQQRYYDEYRFADVFAHLTRAPAATARRLAAIPGVDRLEPRIVFDATLDVPGLPEPAVGRFVSVPEDAQPSLNRLYLRRGRLVSRGRTNEVVISEAFGRANDLEIGDTLSAILNGRWQRLRVVGWALSPEFVYELQGGANIFPDNRRFGVLWIGHRAAEAAFGMRGAFNDVTLDLSRGADEADVIARLDDVLARYGGAGAYGRDDQVSHRFVTDEIQETSVTSVLIPAIFLGVTAFLLHVVVTRLVGTQRDQIAVLKAFGYSNAAVGRHYLGLAVVPVVLGAVVGVALGIWFAVELAVVYARFFQFPVIRYRQDLGVLVPAVAIAVGSAVIGAIGAVRRAVALPPAEAMRPEAPARYRRGILERLGFGSRLALPTRMIARSLERRPVKATLGVVGIALAAAIIVTGGYMFDAVDYMKEIQFHEVQREDMTVLFHQPRPLRARHDLAGLPGVTRVEPFRMAAVRLRRGPRSERTAVLGLDRAGELHRITDSDRRVHAVPAQGLLLTTFLGERLGVRPGDTVAVEVLEGRRRVVDLPVADLVDEVVGSLAYVDLRTANRLLGEGRLISGAWLAVDDSARATLYGAIKRLAAVSGATVRETALTGFEQTIAESFRLSLTLIIAFACLIAAGIVYNGARVALSERGRELASLRVLGFTRGEVARMLLGEQAALTLAAIPAGLGLGYALSWLVATRFGTEMFRVPLVVTGRTYLFSVAIVLAAAVLSALAVRRRLDRIDLVAVLKTRE